MSKGKNNNKANKAGKISPKVQSLKPQAAIVKKNVKPVEIINKVNKNKITKSDNKVVSAKKEIQPKKTEKAKVVTDILESCDDEDESDIDFDEMDDSDIDDVDIEDSDEMDEDDDEEDDDEDDDDLDVEELDNSDYESIELDEEKANAEGEDSEEESDSEDEVEVKVPIKKQQVKEPKKEVKKVEAKEVKEVKKVEAKEVKEVKKVEAKEVKEVKKVDAKETKKAEPKQVKPDSESEDGKLLIEINNRKNSVCDSTVFVSKISSDFTAQTIRELVNTVAPVVHVNLPGKIKNKVMILRGYGFVRMVNSADADKCIEILKKNKMNASKFVCKAVFGDINKVARKKLIVVSFKNEDISEVLAKEFKSPIIVTKSLITQYIVEFPTEEAALAVFNKKSMVLGGHKIVFNFFYGNPRPAEEKEVKETGPVVEKKVVVKAEEKKVVAKAEEKVVAKAEPKPAVTTPVAKAPVAKSPVVEKAPVVKAAVKRALVESSDDESDDEEAEVVVKKFKQINGDEKKVTPKKEKKPEQKTPVATPEAKKMTPKSENKNNKGFDKKPFNKSPGEKKPFEKKPFNKSPAGGKQPFNKSPAGGKQPFNKGNKSPAGGKPQFNKSPGNKKPFNKK